MVGATWPSIQPHLGLSPSKQLDPANEKHLQEVRSYQPLLQQLLKGLTHELQLAKVLPSHPVPQEDRRIGQPPVNAGSGVEASFLR
jgi:hypothetical protein